MHAWLTGWLLLPGHRAFSPKDSGTQAELAQTQAELELLKYAYPPRFRKDMVQAQAELELVKSVRAFTQKRFRSAQPRMLKGHIWLTALQSQTACSVRGFAIATYSLTRRVRRSALAYLPAGERERHCYRMGGMAALLLLI